MSGIAPGRHQLVVLGASAGGVEALTALVSSLPADLGAAVAIVLHLPASGSSVLPAILDRAGGLSARTAVDGEPLQAGRIYCAPPDYHLVIAPGEIGLSHGPSENGHRPSIDALFRTAALAYGTEVIGVVLSGTLDDGAAGLAVIKEHGGVTIVQDPADARYPGMPQAALERGAPDHVVTAAALAALLVELVGGETDDAAPNGPAPDPVVQAAIAEDQASGFMCPQCGGALWSFEESGVPRLRCRIGHAYSEESLVNEQGVQLEEALWAALRSLEERAALLRRISRRADAAGHAGTARAFAGKALDAEAQAEIIRAGVLPVPVDVDAGEKLGS